MIQIVDTGTGRKPILVCDYCDKEIDDAEHAEVIMPDTKPFTNGNKRAIHVHKGDCSSAVEELEGGIVATLEMTAHLRLLINNVKLAPSQFEEEPLWDVTWR